MCTCTWQPCEEDDCQQNQLTYQHQARLKSNHKFISYTFVQNETLCRQTINEAHNLYTSFLKIKLKISYNQHWTAIGRSENEQPIGWSDFTLALR